MTKSEVRAVTLSKLKPQSEDVVLDIGAGTGAVSIECAFLADHVIAVECDADAAALIEANCERFKRNNIRLIIGKAPEALEQIEKVNCVFIGGSKGRLEDILYRVNALLADGGRIAANFIIPENAVLFHKRLQAGGYCEIEMVQVQVNKGRPVVTLPQ